jgi:hypothetical protein
MDIDDEWDNYLKGSELDFEEEEEADAGNNGTNNIEAPECEDLYISTTTKVLYLNSAIDIYNIFWELPVIDYFKPEDGIVKKQMKIVSKTPEEYEVYKQKLENLNYYKENIIKQIHNPSARRIKFKDERKITVGISKKDIMNCRGKVKNAFYNCFAIILRFKEGDSFKEIHVKVFNTGKLEIPGILNLNLLERVKVYVLRYLQPHVENVLYFTEACTEDNVLINSNFKCGFFINRDNLYRILKSDKYCLETSYDPSSYPGIKCKYYFNNARPFDKSVQNGLIEETDRDMKLSELFDNKKYTEISFMIFRTGSCLIVGNCTEKVLRFVYDFIKNILKTEYCNIKTISDKVQVKEKKEKQRKKSVYMTNDYFKNVIMNELGVGTSNLKAP